MNAPGDAAGWVGKAELDFVAARMLSRSRKRGMGAVVCFHCQQCAEKYAKGYLVHHRVSFPKTHDLKSLVDLIATRDGFVETIRGEMTYLNSYSVGVRYPGEGEVTALESREARKRLDVVRNWFRERLAQEGGE